MSEHPENREPGTENRESRPQGEDPRSEAAGPGTGNQQPSFRSEENLHRWRLILGSAADPDEEINLEGNAAGIDGVLEALYDSEREGGLGSSSPNVNRWLGDIRRYFPTSVVQLIQKDALDRLGLERMLLEPELLESLEPDVNLVATLLSLHKVLPQRTRETARAVVRKVVEELQKRLRQPLVQAVKGSLNRATRNHRPKLREIDWHRTIRANLKHYQPELGTIIPERLHGFGRKGQHLRHIVLLVDQSGSMASSVVYAGILGCVLATLRAIRTDLIAFDTSVVDLSEYLEDPVDLLFGTQLGGGTDINQALAYVQPLIRQPRDTVVVLISDLMEGGNRKEMINRCASIKASGAQLVALLALNDRGTPSYDRDIADQLAILDIPAFACTPDQFPDLMAAAINRQDIRQWAGRQQIVLKN